MPNYAISDEQRKGVLIGSLLAGAARGVLGGGVSGGLQSAAAAYSGGINSHYNRQKEELEAQRMEEMIKASQAAQELAQRKQNWDESPGNPDNSRYMNLSVGGAVWDPETKQPIYINQPKGGLSIDDLMKAQKFKSEFGNPDAPNAALFREAWDNGSLPPVRTMDDLASATRRVRPAVGSENFDAWAGPVKEGLKPAAAPYKRGQVVTSPDGSKGYATGEINPDGSPVLTGIVKPKENDSDYRPYFAAPEIDPKTGGRVSWDYRGGKYIPVEGEGQTMPGKAKALPEGTNKDLVQFVNAFDKLNTIEKNVGLSGPIEGRGRKLAAQYLNMGENTQKTMAAENSLKVAIQSAIKGIPSNFDVETMIASMPTLDKSEGLNTELVSQTKSDLKTLFRNTIAYYKHAGYLIPQELYDSAKNVGLDINNIAAWNGQGDPLATGMGAAKQPVAATGGGGAWKPGQPAPAGYEVRRNKKTGEQRLFPKQ